LDPNHDKQAPVDGFLKHFLFLPVILTNQKVAGSINDEVIFFSIYLIFPTTLGLGLTQLLTDMSTRNIKIMLFLGSKVRPVRRADNLTAICEPIV
jgi:hypothetical protein